MRFPPLPHFEYIGQSNVPMLVEGQHNSSHVSIDSYRISSVNLRQIQLKFRYFKYLALLFTLTRLFSFILCCNLANGPSKLFSSCLVSKFRVCRLFDAFPWTITGNQLSKMKSLKFNSNKNIYIYIL